ncbi:hypothetical protein EJ02DRAFT_503754 [Clathrospora elynae]|uniref:Uncharacterized protein n=1 Tax=Clathrospora elynae TaxID=706981 RepID=A0A6A5SNN9_9PLEO|nr:hypothetical protein EJ02DRAFT_503754 [Clathrospora elynae]
MAPTRPSTPPPRSSTMEFSHPPIGPPPSTPGPRNNQLSNNGDGNMILGSEHASVPPSPGMPIPNIGSLSMRAGHCWALLIRKSGRKQNARTGAGVKKTQPKKKADGSLAKLLVDTVTENSGASEKALQQPFRFMDLPGELRNEVYKHTHGRPKQALLVHRPRIASLRPRTRLDRSRTLASDITGQEHDDEIATTNKPRRSFKPKAKAGVSLRETNRPFYGLTQVCRQLRHEFRPIYMAKQEIGMDLTEIVEYLNTFYAEASGEIAKLAAPGGRKGDMPFVGNLTIAVGDKPIDLERATGGVEVFPLLDIWANSFKIEAGFGRYLKANYVPETDGEAKDLYRLFGRRVLRNRSCSSMNNLWRTILRNRSLASVRVHRKPAAPKATVSVPVVSAPVLAPGAAVPEPKAYIHVIFKKEFADPWMTEFESVVPKTPDWLLERGFGGMEYFDVRVGVEQGGAK